MKSHHGRCLREVHHVVLAGIPHLKNGTPQPAAPLRISQHSPRTGRTPAMSAMVFLGLIASAALLVAFTLLNMGKLTPDHYTYQILNFTGAGFLAASAANPMNAGVFWAELVWALLGLYGIISIWVKRRTQKSSPTPSTAPIPSTAPTPCLIAA
ncbi:CBU_0592 family membrane protein [Corynebacterium sp. A21]|uniref:CBU_0592 family membrane protein n=1 Tax=Corynebacterium sp. A21 TaxID=3457318 RepID=UPI003FD340F5